MRLSPLPINKRRFIIKLRTFDNLHFVPATMTFSLKLVGE